MIAKIDSAINLNEMIYTFSEIVMKIYIFFAFMGFALVANANWIPVVEDEGGSITFIDFSTIIKNGNFIKVWKKTVYKKVVPTTKGQMKSAKSYVEFDCREKKSRDLSSVYYSDEQEKNIIYTSNGSDWVYFPPDSVGYTAIAKTCNR